MLFKTIFTNEAEQNVIDLFHWYCEVDFNLGLKFIDEYKTTLKKVSTHPTHYSFVAPKLRRCHFDKMNCIIVYSFKKDIIRILSIKDARSKPNKNFY